MHDAEALVGYASSSTNKISSKWSYRFYKQTVDKVHVHLYHLHSITY